MLGNATTISIEWLAILGVSTMTESPRTKTRDNFQLGERGSDGKCLSRRRVISGTGSRLLRHLLVSITGLRCAGFPMIHTRPPSRTLLIPASSILAPLLLESSNSFTIPVTIIFRILASAFTNISPKPGAHIVGDCTRLKIRV